MYYVYSALEKSEYEKDDESENNWRIVCVVLVKIGFCHVGFFIGYLKKLVKTPMTKNRFTSLLPGGIVQFKIRLEFRNWKDKET